MTYNQNELSVHSGTPIELYKFEGTYDNFYYNTSARDITFAGDKYLAIPMQRTEIVAGTENDDGLNITIDLPVTLDLVNIYGFQDSPPDLTLTIYRYHTIDAVIPYWTGPVASISTNDGISTVLSNAKLATLLAEDYPNVYYQSPCNNVLFDQRCQVVEANYSGAANLVGIVGTVVTIDAVPVGGSGVDLAGRLIGGEVKLSSGERRMIVEQDGVALTINFPFSRMPEENAVVITAGCDHAYLGDCKSKFNNQKNYGGFPFITTDNPFTQGIQEGSRLPDNTCVQSPVKYTISVFSSNPCNPVWSGNRSATIQQTQPNGVNGKIIDTISLPSDGVQDYYIYENVHRGDPLCQGQILCHIVVEDFNTWHVDYYFNPAPGGKEVHIFPAARFCGSVGKGDGGSFSCTSQDYGYPPVDRGTLYAGGVTDTTFDWDNG